jgi:polar amino acid transport system substrate-binding protein
MINRLLLLCIVSFFTTESIATNTINIVSSQWPPYVDDSLPGKGLAFELVNQALQRKGYQPRLNIDSWPRALEGVQIGVFDATCAIWKTAAREHDLLFSQPYLSNKISFIKKKSLKVEYTQLSDLKGFIIGTVRDYAYNDAFDRTRALLKVPANFIIQNLQKLHNGNIELTLGDERAINYALQKVLPIQANTFEFINPVLEYKKLYLAVSKTHKNAQTIIDDFNQAIIEMQQDGSYDQIVSQYPY